MGQYRRLMPVNIICDKGPGKEYRNKCEPSEFPKKKRSHVDGNPIDGNCGPEDNDCKGKGVSHNFKYSPISNAGKHCHNLADNIILKSMAADLRTDNFITVTYSVNCPGKEIRSVCENIALEQTVEVPATVIKDARIFKEIVGTVAAIDEAGPDRFIAKIKYPAAVSNFEMPQFLNLLYGNISFKPGIRVLDVDFSSEFLRSFGGPAFGINGIRKLLGVFDRPLVATALKPMGTSAGDLADICGRFAAGGIDIIKDDHGLVDFPFCGFEERVSKCMHAIEGAQQKTGRKILYFPNITGPFEKIVRNAEYAVRAGAGGLLVSPFLTGLDCVRYIAANESLGKPIMSHPSMSGIFFASSDNGIAPSVVLGKIFRLAGIDSSVYPNYGGRFSFSKETCFSIAGSLRCAMGGMAPSFPAPAGGMDLKDIPEIINFYGNDVILLVGGSLYAKSDDLTANAAFFCETVEASKKR